MSVPSIDGRKRMVGQEPDFLSGHPPPFGFWKTVGCALAAIAFGLAVTVVGLGLVDALKGVWLPLTVLAHLEGLLNAVCLASIAAAVMWGVRRAGWRIRDYFALTPPVGRDFLLVLACLGVMWLVSAGVERIAQPENTDHALLALDYRNAKATGTVLLNWLTVVVIAPIAEEIFYRGFLYRGWSKSRLGISGTILLTAVLFGLAHYHYSWYGQLEIGFFALFAGWLRWRTESLTPPILFHAATGAVSMLYAAMSP